MFRMSCVGDIVWNGGLEEFKNSDGNFLRFIVITDRERMSKYRNYLEGKEDNFEKDRMVCVSYGVIAEYLDAHLPKNNTKLRVELSGYLEYTGEKVKANSSKVTYYEKDMDLPFDNEDAWEIVDSGFEDNVYIKLDSYRFLVKEVSVIEPSKKNSKPKKTASKKKTNTKNDDTNDDDGNSGNQFTPVDEDF